MSKPEARKYYDYQGIKHWLRIEFQVEAQPLLVYLTRECHYSKGEIVPLSDELFEIANTDENVRQIIELILKELGEEEIELRLDW